LAVGARAAHAAEPTTVRVNLTKQGCSTHLHATAGSVRFVVKNINAKRVTEFEVLQGSSILGEAEDIAIGNQSEFVVTLDAGEYITLCPGGTRHRRGVLTVTD
jgi:iron uptake system EfeUOB component EfeO/EfeM